MIGSEIFAKRALATGLLSLLAVVVIITLGFGIGQALAETPTATQAQGAGQAAAATEAPAAASTAAKTEDAEAAEATEETEEATPAEDPAFAGAVSEKLRRAEFAQRTMGRMRSITAAQRKATFDSIKARLGASGTTRNSARGGTLDMGAPRNAFGDAVDYFMTPNWALSPLPTVTGPAVNGVFPVAAGTGIKKFQDSLPGLGSAQASTLGANIFIPVATPIATTTSGTYPTGVPHDADYYELEAGAYTYNMLSGDTPGSPVRTTHLRGYRDVNAAAGEGGFHYLGPVIIANKDMPVRLKVTNSLPQDVAVGATGFTPFLPVDKSYMGAGQGPLGGYYTNNRTDVHLHGGLTPWISDGTPHQWFVPAVEPAGTVYRKGASYYNVPDMPDPGNGAATYYYTNAQSARLMFYHDHAYGITRLNVYDGLAAGYLIVDNFEKSMIKGTANSPVGFNLSGLKVLPDLSDLDPNYTYGIPLVIQDKSFVPDATALAAQDPTWNTAAWGGEGDLWFPHVYMPNQNPADNSGANNYGRWDWGPWFWPPQRTVTVDPAAANGVPAGTAPQGTPEGHAGCKAVNAALWPNLTCPWTPNPSGVPEGFMDTPLVNGLAYPYLPVQKRAYRFRVLNAANDRMINLGVYYAADAAGNVCNSAAIDPSLCTEMKMVPAMPHPTVAPPPELPAPDADDPVLVCGSVGALAPPNCWPTAWPTDGRDGGVPDPTTVGPPIIQIGHEGGFLPAPVTIPSTPTGYEYNRRSIVVLNISTHGLLLAAAERADILVDFSAVPAGATLMLYNDAPAPVPAFDPRNDYYTGAPDNTFQGGAPPTIAGYGPNTRTIMQFRVGATTGAGLDLVNLPTLLGAAFTQGQPPIIVPQMAYGFPGPDIFASIQATELHWGAPKPGGTTLPTLWKAIHELFTTDYGRMNALLGTELPLTTWLTQTTIPLSYIDPPTEVINEGDTQLWKITHNGVDSHGVHVHLFDAQLINRVGWDGAIRPPEPNELGWKETIRMNPLEDVYIALRPQKPPVPFLVPDSVRLLDTTRAAGTTTQFTGIDPVTNNPITVTNQLTNFHWEYVWHCHLLGHEENDMMRPIVYNVVPPVPPAAPLTLTATATGNAQITLNWTYTANGVTAGTGFMIQRATGLGGFLTIGTLTGGTGVTTYPDNTAAPNTVYSYRVITTGALVNSLPSNTATITMLRMPGNPTLLSNGATQVIITWAAPSPTTGVTGYQVYRARASAPTVWTLVGTQAGVTSTTFRNTNLSRGTAYLFRVRSTGAGGAISAYTANLAVTTLP